MPIYCRTCGAEHSQYKGFFEPLTRNVSGYDYTCLVCRRNAPSKSKKQNVPLDVMLTGSDNMHPSTCKSILKKVDGLSEKLDYHPKEMDWSDIKETVFFKVNIHKNK